MKNIAVFLALFFFLLSSSHSSVQAQGSDSSGKDNLLQKPIAVKSRLARWIEINTFTLSSRNKISYELIADLTFSVSSTYAFFTPYPIVNRHRVDFVLGYNLLHSLRHTEWF